jgi:hypothetical protein
MKYNNTFIFEDRKADVFKIGNVFYSKDGIVPGLKKEDSDYIFEGHMSLPPPYVCADNVALANLCGKDGCGGIGQFICSKCMTIMYCSEKCQQNCCF